MIDVAMIDVVVDESRWWTIRRRFGPARCGSRRTDVQEFRCASTVRPRRRLCVA
jgi:hypothetical protein